MEAGGSFAPFGRASTQVGNITKGIGGTTLGYFDTKGLVEGSSEASADFCLSLNRILFSYTS